MLKFSEFRRFLQEYDGIHYLFVGIFFGLPLLLFSLFVWLLGNGVYLLFYRPFEKR